MSQLAVDNHLPDFSYKTPFGEGVFSEAVKKEPGKTILLFLRFYGCRLCQYELQLYARSYDSIRASDAQLIAVVQSNPIGLASQITESSYPFSIICDPEGTLYHKFGIAPAESREAMLSEIENRKVAEAERLGLVHGVDEGEPLQLPAMFIVEQDLTLSYVHYGKTAGDIPSPETVIDFLTR